MKQFLNRWAGKKINKDVVGFNIFQEKHHILLALMIGGLVTAHAALWGLLVEDKFLLFATETPMTLLPFVIIEELAKVVGIYFLISTRKNVSGLSVILIPATFEMAEVAVNLFKGFGLWRIIIPLHVITGIIYLRFLRISKRILFVAFVINSLLHWAWNIQTTITESASDLTITLIFFAWATLAIYAFRSLVGRTEAEKGVGF